MAEIRRILVAVDFSAASRRALEYALDLAEGVRATIEALHVVEPGAFVMPPPDLPAGSITEQEAANVATSDARGQLEALCLAVAGPDRAQLIVARRVQIGTPVEEIIALAELEKFDLLVLGRHGHRRLAHMLMGSVVSEVIRRCPQPVLTVQDPG